MNHEKPIPQANGRQIKELQTAVSAVSGSVSVSTDKPTDMATRVEIYVAEHCMICEYAYEVADSIRTDFPHVDLRIINLSKTTEAIPEAVFATPTYLLNGRLWSLGNPSPEDVQERLSPALDDRFTTNTQAEEREEE